MQRPDALLWLASGLAVGALVVRRGAAEAVEVREVVQQRLGDEVPAGRRFDALFAKRGRGLPVAYLRALAKRESNLNPREQTGAAWGLLQVTEIVRRDFNQRHGSSISRRDLLDPEVNVGVAAELLERIIASYERNHPGVANLQEDWSNPRFVELLTFGWNAGYSERGGVGRVARYLETRSLSVTIDTVHKCAVVAGASRHLSNPKKVEWCKGVARLFYRERRREVSLAHRTSS